MSAADILSFREHVPAACRRAYFETAGTGLIPDFVHDMIAAYQEERYLVGGDSVWRYPDGQVTYTSGMLERAGQAMARMLGTDRTNIFFGQNTSQVYALLTSGMPFVPGDNVILPAGGWMANRFAWQMRERDGLEIRYVKPHDGEIRLTYIKNLCDSRTKAVCLPFVEPSTGFAIDAYEIGAFCRERGIWFAVDATQAAGILPVDVSTMKIDFLAGNDYKWMMNYCGTGYGYISPELRDALEQRSAGWMSDDDRANTKKQKLSLRKDAGRFELGYPAVSGICGLGLVAEKYCEFGGETIRSYVFDLIDYLKAGISDLQGVSLMYDFKPKNRSGIVILRIRHDVVITAEMFDKAGIAARIENCPDGGRKIRLSIHYYNNRADVDRLLKVLKNGGIRK